MKATLSGVDNAIITDNLSGQVPDKREMSFLACALFALLSPPWDEAARRVLADVLSALV